VGCPVFLLQALMLSGLLALHFVASGSIHLFSKVDFVVALSCHTSGNTAKDNIGNNVEAFGKSVISFAWSEASDNSTETGSNLQTVVASNELDIILI